MIYTADTYIGLGCQINALRNALKHIKELIVILKINTTKNFHPGAIITTPNRQLLAQKHVIRHIDH